MGSVWEENHKTKDYERLNKNITTDVLIIGGGFAGLLCAYELNKAGIDCVVAEAKKICSGVSGNTTAKITLQHGLIYSEITKQYGKEKAGLYFEAQQKALDKYERLCESIDCDYEKKDSYVYSLKDFKKIKNEVDSLNKVGIDAEFCNSLNLPLNIAGAVRIRGQAQFHPLKFIAAITREMNIYEDTKIIELRSNTAITQYGKIKFNKVIVATHFPVFNKHGMYFMKMFQHRSYVIALKGAANIEGMYVDESESGMSFRNYKDLLLLGGGSHRTGKKGCSRQELEDFARKNYPSSKIVNRWAAQDCMTLDGMPYIGLYSKNTPDVYVATGFNKWGISSSMVSADMLCDMIRGVNNKYEALFSPSRSMLKPQLVTNLFESAIGLLTPATPRCPHMGCALKYNRYEHSWDCPCHGSRFDANGALLDNPAMNDKTNI